MGEDGTNRHLTSNSSLALQGKGTGGASLGGNTCILCQFPFCHPSKHSNQRSKHPECLSQNLFSLEFIGITKQLSHNALPLLARTPPPAAKAKWSCRLAHGLKKPLTYTCTHKPFQSDRAFDITADYILTSFRGCSSYVIEEQKSRNLILK